MMKTTSAKSAKQLHECRECAGLRHHKAARPVAKKKICAEFKFWHMGSRRRHFTRIEARFMKWDRYCILAVLAAVVYLVAVWLAKH
jgi:hypothetical protein